MVKARKRIAPWVIEALEHLGGSASFLDISRHVWDHHEADIRAGDELLYEWQYELRAQFIERATLAGRNASGTGDEAADAAQMKRGCIARFFVGVCRARCAGGIRGAGRRVCTVVVLVVGFVTGILRGVRRHRLRPGIRRAELYRGEAGLSVAQGILRPYKTSG